jgi:hypothetical protein
VEILQYLRRRPGAVALLVLMPLLAAQLAYLLLQRQPAQYLGEARVIVPSDAARSASAVGLYIADFAVLVESQETVQAVSAGTGVTAEELRDGLEVNREGQSSLFTVTYTTDQPDKAEPVLRTAITTTMSRMAPTTDAEARLEQARAAATDAQNQLRAFQDEIGVLFPEREYNDLSSQIRSLQNSPSPADQALRQQYIARRDALVPQVRTYEELTRRVSQTAAELQNAEEAAAQNATASADVREGRPIQRLTITPAPSRQLVQAVGIGAALGLLGAIALVVGPDLIRGARRGRTGPSGSSTGTSTATSLDGAAGTRAGTTTERPEPTLRPARPDPTPAGAPVVERPRARSSQQESAGRSA